MPKCDTCGNDYDRAMRITLNGRTHHFDCFECAIHKLAPRCGHCGCRVIGHGVQADDAVFCCDHCTREHGAHAPSTGAR